jgi:uncharacterized protein (DUF1015 family)
MANVQPFRALRPTPESAAAVASVPYDVVSTAEAKELAAGNPDSFLHVIRSEIDLPEGTDSHGDAAYAKAKANLGDLQARGALVREETPCLYLYRQIWGEHTQVGLVGAFSVEEYDTDKILKHEFTRPDKEADRTRHIVELGAQAGPVFLTYRPSAAVDAIVGQVTAGAPFSDFTAPDGIQHTVWRVDEPAALAEAMGQVDPLYVADGHHRSAAASNVRKQRGEAGQLGADDPSHRFLAVAFPTDQVKILAYNRLVHDLGDRSPEAFLQAVAAALPVSEAADAEPGPGQARMYLSGRWHTLTLEPQADDPVSRLEVQVLQDRVLSPLLGIEDPRTDDRISFVGGIRGTQALADAVDQGAAQVAFSLPAVTPAQLLAVADAKRTMPPKSTWFEPKLRSGLFTYLI